MKSIEAVLTSREKIEFREKETVALNDDQVLVEVVSCGVCSSELPVFFGESNDKRGVSFRYAGYPCFLGHEVSGIVADTGPAAKSLKRGDRVTGIAYSGSGFASFVTESERAFVKVPESIPLEFAIGEPLMAITNTVRMSQPDIGDRALLVGDGFMSLMTVAVLSKYPLDSIAVVGHHEYRLAVAKELGASMVVNAKMHDPYWEVRRFIDGASHDASAGRWENGVDIAYEFAGRMRALQLCASLCKPKQRAKLMMASYYGEEIFTLGHYLINRAPSLMPSFPAHSLNPVDDLRRAVWALSEDIFPVDRVITHIFPLEQVERALRTASLRSEGYIKGIVVPDMNKLESGSTHRIVG